ncbi:MAG: SCP2 sterol-binding domain-containing protein [Pseudomonadota bacterium]
MTTTTLGEAAQKAFTKSFGAVIELRPEGAEPFFIDGRADPPKVSTAPPGAAPDCVWRGPADVMRRAVASARAVESAVINGRLVIGGDMSVMTRLELSA